MIKEKFNFIEIERDVLQAWQDDLSFILDNSKHKDSREAVKSIINEIEWHFSYKNPDK